MNEMKSISASWRTLSLPLLLLLIVVLFATLLTAGVAFAGHSLNVVAGNSSGPAAWGNGSAQGQGQGQVTPTPSCTPNWTVYPNPAPPGDSVLNGVTAIGPNDLWAVGYYTDSGTRRTLTVHGDGTTWTQVPSPNPGSGNAVLQGVAGVAPNDVWAVGTGITQTLTMHWDGTAWTIVPSPNGPRPQNHLYAVTVIASNDVWAVGYGDDGVFVGQLLIEHWNGSTWTLQIGPGGNAQPRLYGVAAADGRVGGRRHLRGNAD